MDYQDTRIFDNMQIVSTNYYDEYFYYNNQSGFKSNSICIRMCASDSQCSSFTAVISYQVYCYFYNSTNLIFKKTKDESYTYLKLPVDSEVITNVLISYPSGGLIFDSRVINDYRAFTNYSCYYKCLKDTTCRGVDFRETYVRASLASLSNKNCLFIDDRVSAWEFAKNPVGLLIIKKLFKEEEKLENVSMASPYWYGYYQPNATSLCYNYCFFDENCKAVTYTTLVENSNDTPNYKCYFYSQITTVVHNTSSYTYIMNKDGIVTTTAPPFTYMMISSTNQLNISFYSFVMSLILFIILIK